MCFAIKKLKHVHEVVLPSEFAQADTVCESIDEATDDHDMSLYRGWSGRMSSYPAMLEMRIWMPIPLARVSLFITLHYRTDTSAVSIRSRLRVVKQHTLHNRVPEVVCT